MTRFNCLVKMFITLQYKSGFYCLNGESGTFSLAFGFDICRTFCEAIYFISLYAHGI